MEVGEDAFNAIENDPKLYDAVSSYTSNGYIDINRRLRGLRLGDGTDSYAWLVDEQIANLRKAMDIFGGLKEDVVLYRGTTHKWISKKKLDEGDLGKLVGTVISDKGFLSTSVVRKVADGFVRHNQTTSDPGYIIEYRVPKGTKGLYVGSLSFLDYEEEVILEPGLSWVIVEAGMGEMPNPKFPGQTVPVRKIVVELVEQET